MQITRITDAGTYETKAHFDMVGLRLQGAPVSATSFATIGLSHFLPGGGAESSTSNIEKIYIMVSGEMTVITDEGESVLGALDSCLLAAGERRALINRSNLPASMLVILPGGKS